MQKKATAPSVLDRLKAIKAESDRKNYARKHQLLRVLLQDYPSEFVIDSPGGKHPGITHSPTGFRMHAPAGIMGNIKTARRLSELLEHRCSPAGFAGQSARLPIKCRPPRDPLVAGPP
jgi:hypothetical protein